MTSVLIESKINRQNILNNDYAISEVQDFFEFDQVIF